MCSAGALLCRQARRLRARQRASVRDSVGRSVRQTCFLCRARQLSLQLHSWPLQFPRLAHNMYVAAPHFRLVCRTHHGLISCLLLCYLWRCRVHRVNGSVTSDEPARAAASFLASRATSTMKKCATAAICDTVEDCPSYTRMRLAPQLLLVLLLPL